MEQLNRKGCGILPSDVNNSRRLKVLWLSHVVPYPPKGGVLQRCYNMLKECGKNNDIDLVCFIQRNLMVTQFDSISAGLEEAKRALKAHTTNISLVDITTDKNRLKKLWLIVGSFFSTKTYTVNWMKSREYRRAIKECLQNNKYDVIYVGTLAINQYRDELGNYPKVLDHHNIESHMMRRRANKENNILKKLYFYWEAQKLQKYEAQCCSQYNLNIVCSDVDKQRLLNVDGDCNVATIENGVDTAYFKPAFQKRKRNTAIFVGGLTWYPNVEAMTYILDELWPLITKEFPDFELIHIGRGKNNNITKKANQFKNVRLKGFVDDIRPYLNSALIYLCPIQNGGGTKLKVLDALAMGKVILCHKEAAEGIDVVNGKNIYVCDTPTDYLDRIKELVANENRVANMEKHARELIEAKYSYDKIGRRFDLLMNEISRHEFE